MFLVKSHVDYELNQRNFIVCIGWWSKEKDREVTYPKYQMLK